MHKISYISDGTTTEFSFSFPFFQIDDVHVVINDGKDTDKFNCSVIPNEDFSGGNIVFDVAPDAGVRIDIFRQISLSRVIDYQPTRQITPEDLNSDFNFLLAAFQDLRSINIDLSEWANVHDNVKALVSETLTLIKDKLSGGGVLGLYQNLLSVLDNALPKLINDYGCITDPAPNENSDDYGVL